MTITATITYKGLATEHGKLLGSEIRSSNKSAAAIRRERRELATAMRVAVARVWDKMPIKGSKEKPGRTSKDGRKIFIHQVNQIPECRDVAIIATSIKATLQSLKNQKANCPEEDRAELEQAIKDWSSALAAHKAAFEPLEIGGFAYTLRGGKGKPMAWASKVEAKGGKKKSTPASPAPAPAESSPAPAPAESSPAPAPAPASASQSSTDRTDKDLGPAARMAAILDQIKPDRRSEILADLLVHAGSKVTEQAVTLASKRFAANTAAQKASGGK